MPPAPAVNVVVAAALTGRVVAAVGCRGIDVHTAIFPAATDSRYLRVAGYPAFGFSPMNNTPILLHDHDEFVPVDVFCTGVAVYEKMIPVLTRKPVA